MHSLACVLNCQTCPPDTFRCAARKFTTMSQPTRLFDFPRYQLANRPLDLSDHAEQRQPHLVFNRTIRRSRRPHRSRDCHGPQRRRQSGLGVAQQPLQWNIMDHAIMSVGAINCPLYPTMTRRITSTSSTTARAGTAPSAGTLRQGDVHQGQNPFTRTRIMFEHGNGNHWSAIAEAAATPSRPNSMPMAASKPEDLATIIYTSGTGTPRGSCSATTTSPRP